MFLQQRVSYQYPIHLLSFIEDFDGCFHEIDVKECFWFEQAPVVFDTRFKIASTYGCFTAILIRLAWPFAF